MKFLHSTEVMHRDIKPANLLVTANYGVKICDFGLSRTVKRDYNLCEKLTKSPISESKSINTQIN